MKFVQELLTVVTLMGTGKLGDLLPILTIVLGELRVCRQSQVVGVK